MRKTTYNQYKILQYKMNLEKFNYQNKVNKHIEMKKEHQTKNGPGEYHNPKTASDFKRELKPEHL